MPSVAESGPYWQWLVSVILRHSSLEIGSVSLVVTFLPSPIKFSQYSTFCFTMTHLLALTFLASIFTRYTCSLILTLVPGNHSEQDIPRCCRSITLAGATSLHIIADCPTVHLNLEGNAISKSIVQTSFSWLLFLSSMDKVLGQGPWTSSIEKLYGQDYYIMPLWLSIDSLFFFKKA